MNLDELIVNPDGTITLEYTKDNADYYLELNWIFASISNEYKVKIWIGCDFGVMQVDDKEFTYHPTPEEFIIIRNAVEEVIEFDLGYYGADEWEQDQQDNYEQVKQNYYESRN